MYLAQTAKRKINTSQDFDTHLFPMRDIIIVYEYFESSYIFFFTK